MTDGAKCKSNQRLRKNLLPVIRAMYPGTVFRTKDITDKVRSPYREISTYTLGSLLKELDEAKSHGHGVWERVKA